MGAASMSFELEPSEGGTRIRMMGRASPPGLLKVLDPIMGVMMRRHFDDMAEGIHRDTAKPS